MKLYLAHPMTTANNGTIKAKEDLLAQIASLLPGVKVIDPSSYGLKDGTHDEQIVLQNKLDILHSSAVVADFTFPSSGVGMEAIFARVNGIPVVGYTLQGKVSAWVTHVCRFTATTPEGVIMATKMVLKV